MKCPVCASTNTQVKDSRVARQGAQIRRRRLCANTHCGHRFTTYESVENVAPNVQKANSSVEPFDGKKVLRSLRLACQKRPVSLETLTDFVAHLETRVAQGSNRVVTSRAIGELVLEFLWDLDSVAYVRYASVYRSFESLEQFIDETLKLQQRQVNGAGSRGGGETP